MSKRRVHENEMDSLQGTVCQDALTYNWHNLPELFTDNNTTILVFDDHPALLHYMRVHKLESPDYTEKNGTELHITSDGLDKLAKKISTSPPSKLESPYKVPLLEVPYLEPENAYFGMNDNEQTLLRLMAHIDFPDAELSWVVNEQQALVLRVTIFHLNPYECRQRAEGFIRVLDEYFSRYTGIRIQDIVLPPPNDTTSSYGIDFTLRQYGQLLTLANKCLPPLEEEFMLPSSRHKAEKRNLHPQQQYPVGENQPKVNSQHRSPSNRSNSHSFVESLHRADIADTETHPSPQERNESNSPHQRSNSQSFAEKVGYDKNTRADRARQQNQEKGACPSFCTIL
jgi:hypothetical protein